MPIIAGDWSVVILGAWNRAILTPSGISKRLFELNEGTQIDVLVPIDVMAPFRVKHGEVSVTASADYLIITPMKPTFANLESALKIARRALTKLPETPVSAAGVNLKYRSDQPMPALSKLVENPVDQSFADNDIKVMTRALLRSVEWKESEVRISVSQESDMAYSILLNFHKEADTTEKLKDWLSFSLEEARGVVEKLIFNCLGLTREDMSDAEQVQSTN